MLYIHKNATIPNSSDFWRDACCLLDNLFKAMETQVRADKGMVKLRKVETRYEY